MSEILIFVEDLPKEDPNCITGSICMEISYIGSELGKNFKSIVVTDENVRIADCMSLLKSTMRKEVDLNKDVLAGFCIDLFDVRGPQKVDGRNVHDGEILLEKIKQDPELQVYDVLLYSSRHMEVDEQALLDKGAVAFVVRDVTRGGKEESVYRLLAKRILKALKCI